MIRQYYTDYDGEYHYSLKEDVEKKTYILNDDNATVYLTFDAIRITNPKDVVNRHDIYFNVYGILFNANENNEELINTTAMLHERKEILRNNTINTYSLNEPEKFTLVFQNVSRRKDFIYDLQLQVNVKIQDNIFNEEFLVFTFKVNLTEIKFEEPEESKWWIILISVIGGLLLIVILFLLYKYIRLRKSNVNLKEDLKSMAFSNDVQKNVLIKEKKLSQKESDYETTFI